MRVALADADNLPIADTIGVHLGVPVEVVLAPQEEIHAAINRTYSAQDSRVASVLGGIRSDDQTVQLESFIADNDLLDAAGSAPVVQLVNSLLFDAIKRRASDVHIQPFAEHVQVRLRIDGVLYDDVKPPRRLLDEIVSRIKVIGRTVSEVPLLGRIPWLGLLFQNSSASRTRTRIYAFIRPIVLRDDRFADLRYLSAGALEEAGIEGKDFPGDELMWMR